MRKTCHEVARAESGLITFQDMENQKNNLEVRRGDLGPQQVHGPNSSIDSPNGATSWRPGVQMHEPRVGVDHLPRFSRAVSKNGSV